MIYFDASYLVRLYFKDPGFDKVRLLAQSASVCSTQLGRAEVAAALHRKLREGAITPELYRIAIEEFAKENAAGAFRWLPLSDAVLNRVQHAYQKLPPHVFLRAGDAVHLATAAEHHLREAYSNDRHFSAAASCFGLRAVNVI